MLTNDLFNTDYERRISEGAVDQLEQRRIDDLNMKMDELANRVKSTSNPEHKKSLLKSFLDCKAERDSYYKLREAGIGQDIADKSEKIARATPSTPAGKVASTVKNAAKWLAGKGGPGKEGPTYEEQELDEKLKGMPTKKLGSARDLGKSVRKFRKQSGLAETDAWSQEGPWTNIPKNKAGQPVDPRGEVAHMSDVARRETGRIEQGIQDWKTAIKQKYPRLTQIEYKDPRNPRAIPKDGSFVQVALAKTAQGVYELGIISGNGISKTIPTDAVIHSKPQPYLGSEAQTQKKNPKTVAEDFEDLPDEVMDPAAWKQLDTRAKIKYLRQANLFPLKEPGSTYANYNISGLDDWLAGEKNINGNQVDLPYSIRDDLKTGKLDLNKIYRNALQNYQERTHSSSVSSQDREHELNIGSQGRAELKRQADELSEIKREKLRNEKLEDEAIAFQRAETVAQRKAEMEKIRRAYEHELSVINTEHRNNLEIARTGNTHEINKLKMEYAEADKDREERQRESDRDRAERAAEREARRRKPQQAQPEPATEPDETPGQPFRPQAPAGPALTRPAPGRKPNKYSNDDAVDVDFKEVPDDKPDLPRLTKEAVAEEDNGPYVWFKDNPRGKGRPLNMSKDKAIKFVKGREIMQQQVANWGALVDNTGKIVFRYDPRGRLPERFKGEHDDTTQVPADVITFEPIEPGSDEMTRALGPDRGSNQGTYFNQDNAQDWRDWAQDKEDRKKTKEVAEDRPRDLAASAMLKRAHAAYPLANNDAEALALYIAAKEQRDVDRLEKENEYEDTMLARLADQLKKTEVSESNVNPKFIIAQVTKLLATEARRMTNAPMAQLLAPIMQEYGLSLQQIDAMVPGGLKKAAGEYGIMMKEGWSDAIVAQRTGRPRTPYSVFIKGKKWKDFENDDHAEAVANKLRAKFEREGKDPSVITIAATGSVDEAQDWQGNYGAGQAQTTDHTMDEAIEYVKGNYPYAKKYRVRRAEPGFRANRDAGEFNRSAAHVTDVDSAMDYLQLRENPVMSGSKQISASLGYSWHTNENRGSGIAVFYYEDRGMGWDEIIVAAKDKKNLAAAVQVFRDAGVVPELKSKSVKEGDQIRLGDVQPGTAGYDAWRKSTHQTEKPGEKQTPAGKGDYDWTEKQKIMPKVLPEGEGSWIVYDPATKQIKKRFKTHTAGKSYAKVHNLGFASSEYYFDKVKDQKAIAEAGDRVDPILIKALNNMPDGLASHGEVLNACYDAYAMELGKMAMKSEYGTTRAYIPQLMDLYKQKHGLTFNEEKTRLDPKCWKGKKIGNPKTKIKGGVRVNNCVPAEESYTKVMESQGVTDPTMLDVARRIDLFAKTIK